MNSDSSQRLKRPGIFIIIRESDCLGLRLICGALERYLSPNKKLLLKSSTWVSQSWLFIRRMFCLKIAYSRLENESDFLEKSLFYSHQEILNKY